MEHEKLKNEKETDETERIDVFSYDLEFHQFPDVIEYKGQSYDAREATSDRCMYRMTAEHRVELEEPSYVIVDKEGRVLETKN